MISTIWIEGQLCLILHRCNEYGDHQELGRDGDILFDLAGNGNVDAQDAQWLVEQMQSRLTPVAADAAISTHGDGPEQTAAPLKPGR